MSLLNKNDPNFTPAVPKLAATVLICRALEQVRNGFDYEVLFVKRKETARFMPGYHVFPGGITEPSDEIPEDHPLLPCPLSESLHDPVTRTLRLAATREVFEESNVLLCDPIVPPEQLAKWRPRVLKDCTQFVPMLQELQCKPIWENLYEWAHWITPEAEKYRYDTYFYLIPITSARKVNALHDELETTRHDWKTPGEVLEAYGKKKFQLAPPTWITVAELCAFKTLSELENVAKQGRDISPIIPNFIMKVGEDGTNEIVLCLPGDKESSTPLSGESLRRLVIRPGESYKFISSLASSAPWESFSSLQAKM